MQKDYSRNNDSGMMSSLSALLMGIIVGAAAVFFSDERNRKRVRATMDDWKEKANDAREEIEDKAQDLKQQGLARVSDELSRTQEKVRRQTGTKSR